MASASILISEAAVQATIDNFTKLDASGDKKAMNKMARRLGKEQPALLAFAARHRDEHGDKVGEAAVFYSTLVWAMFDRSHESTLPRLTSENIDAAEEEIKAALEKVEGLADKAVHERTAPELVDRQPDMYRKLQELIAEDVTEEAITAECAEVVFPITQVIIEAFNAALDGRRPGEQQGTIVREQPKVGRNEPCPCGSGKKFKKCCGA